MASIHEWLLEAGFNFEAGEIVYQDTGGDSAPGWSTPEAAGSMTDEVLHRQFDNGWGSPECPRFFARCGSWLYFPQQYDGATSLVKVNVNPSYYLDPGNRTPYPGG